MRTLPTDLAEKTGINVIETVAAVSCSPGAYDAENFSKKLA